MVKNKTPGNIDMNRLQELIDAHDGITSQELSIILFGDNTRDHVTSVSHCCVRGIRTHELDIIKRRANMSIYVTWYPSKYRGEAITELEKCMKAMDVFTIRALGEMYHETKNVGRSGFAKLEKYVELMVEDGTLEELDTPRGMTQEFRWSNAN